jgi:hypothetical protein
MLHGLPGTLNFVLDVGHAAEPPGVELSSYFGPFVAAGLMENFMLARLGFFFALVLSLLFCALICSDGMGG